MKYDQPLVPNNRMNFECVFCAQKNKTKWHKQPTDHQEMQVPWENRLDCILSARDEGSVIYKTKYICD